MRQHRPFRTASGPVRALYALQARVALTGVEAATLLAVTLALAAGFALRAYQGHPTPAAGAVLFPADTTQTAPVVAPAVTSPSPATTPPPPARGAVQVNVNAAGAAELERLPGIGPVLAARIVEYRARYGPFRSVRALLDVRGIGPRKLEALAPLVVL